jgi:hypothetical protein
MSRGRPAQGEIVRKRKYIVDYGDAKWYYDLDKFANGPYMVEHFDPMYDKLENLYLKWQKLQEPEYHENGRKKRITKDRAQKIKNHEALYWEEHYRLFPEDRPKTKSKRRKRNS